MTKIYLIEQEINEQLTRVTYRAHYEDQPHDFTLIIDNTVDREQLGQRALEYHQKRYQQIKQEKAAQAIYAQDQRQQPNATNNKEHQNFVLNANIDSFI